MKTFKKLSKLKNPMKDMNLLFEFIESVGKVFFEYSEGEEKQIFYNLGRFQAVVYKEKRLITKRQIIHFSLPDYKGNIYHFDYCLETEKIKQSRIYDYSKEDFVELKEFFLKFLLNKELSKLENKTKEKVRKI